MKKILFPVVLIAIGLFISGCDKWKGEHTDLYSYTIPAASPVSDAAPLTCGGGSTISPVKGTMLSGKTYSVTAGCDLVINVGDTLVMQPGVTLNMGKNSSLIALGTLVSNGSALHPNFIGAPGIKKYDTPDGIPAAQDSAYKGKWKGIIGGPACPLMVLRWTHIEFAGGTEGDATSKIASSGTGNQFSILFANYKGNFIMEDSWLYGGVDDPIRVSNGNIALFHNTFEKNGAVGGDCVNVKGGTVGTMAYNLFIGTATNGQKASNKGQPVGAPQTNVVMYNNTFISGGYRQTQTGRGGCINYEEGAKGMYYNNIAVNCRFGYRVVGSPIADTVHMAYGNNFQYGDSVAVTNQFYPTGYITIPRATDIPKPTINPFLPSNYYSNLGATYDGSSLIQKNNPAFVNFPLPTSGHALASYSSVGSFNFHLLSTSPLAGKGYTAFQPLITVPLNPIYGLAEVTLPGVDLGCYQLNGVGNQH